MEHIMQDSNIEAQRRDTAFHEAGHVVVSYRLGFQLGYTTIEPNAADGTAGAASGRDNERAAEILGRHSELSAVQLRPRAEALVIEHWKEIEAVSAALIEDITLNETEPQIICDAVG